MKFKQLLVVIFLFGCLIMVGCRKKNRCETVTSTGRIIGYNPCGTYVQANRVYGAGFVIELDKATSKDTVVTYQIPEDLFVFKPEYIDKTYSSFLFRPEVQNLFKINFNYKIATDEEKTVIICSGMINTAWYDAAVRHREIFVSCISKQ